MKIIKVTTENKISIHEYPEGDFYVRHNTLCSLIGPECELYQQVRPRRLYTEMGCPSEIGKAVSMLVDESGLLKDLDLNAVGSWLYETDKHMSPIVGNILFIGEHLVSDGIEFCGIPDAEFRRLYPILEDLAKKVRFK